MAWKDIIINMLLFGIGVGAFLLGGISIYFGARRNRRWGMVLCIIGVILLFVLYCYEAPFIPLFMVFLTSLIGLAIGMAIIALIFLFIVLK